MTRCDECQNRGMVGGSALTPYTCIGCGSEEIWGNTNHPNLCSECMKKATESGDACVWCGKEL